MPRSHSLKRSALQVVEGIDLSGRVCVITGASSGLGRESARALAAAGAHVILATRNQEALSQTARWIAAEVRGARVSTVQLDLTALDGVRAAAAAIRDITPAVHVLMNNAGVMFTPFGRTEDGFELQIGTNHFEHFELTRLLVPQLAAAGNARIVNLSSGGHILGDVDFDDPSWERRDYDKFEAYGASKTANILHANEADRRLRELGIRAYAVHPRPWPPRWRGTCPARTSRGYANSSPPAPPRAANRTTAISTSPLPSTARPPRCGPPSARNLRTKVRCIWKTAASATRSRRTHATSGAWPTSGISPKSSARQGENKIPRRAHGSGSAVQSRETRDVNRGGRRSRNAATPSRASAPPITRWCNRVSSDATCLGV